MASKNGATATKAKHALCAVGLAAALLCGPAIAGYWGTSGYAGLGFIGVNTTCTS